MIDVVADAGGGCLIIAGAMAATWPTVASAHEGVIVLAGKSHVGTRGAMAMAAPPSDPV